MDLVWNMVYMYCDGSGLPSWTEIVFPLKMVTVRSLFAGFRGLRGNPCVTLGANPAGVGPLVPLPRDSSGSGARLGVDRLWRSRLGLRWGLHFGRSLALSLEQRSCDGTSRSSGALSVAPCAWPFPASNVGLGNWRGRQLSLRPPMIYAEKALA